MAKSHKAKCWHEPTRPQRPMAQATPDRGPRATAGVESEDRQTPPTPPLSPPFLPSSHSYSLSPGRSETNRETGARKERKHGQYKDGTQE